MSELSLKPACVLIVDDEHSVLASLSRLLRRDGYDIDTASSGEEALELIEANEYAVILCDQRMPGMTGAEVLSRARRSLPHAVRMTLTGYTDIESAIRSVNDGGVQHFLLKPWDNEHVCDVVRGAVRAHRAGIELRAAQATVVVQRDQLHELSQHLEQKVLERTSDLIEAHEGTLRALVAALDAREQATAGHSWRVAVYTVYLARCYGINKADLEDLYRGAVLHDIGKIGIPDSILLKPGLLSAEERRIIETHVLIGGGILKNIKHLQSAVDIPMYHHEKYDGTGYPHKISGESIPVSARLFAVADVYDALTSERPYKAGLSHWDATQIIKEQSGSHFDPQIVSAFVSIPDAVFQVLGSTANCLGGLDEILRACDALEQLPRSKKAA